MKPLSALILIILFALSCKKKEFPSNQIDDPAFYIQAEVNGLQINLNAGNNGYYMYSSFTQDTLGIYSFVSSLKKNNCTSNCPFSFKIEITDNQLSDPAGQCNIQNSLNTGEYSYANPASLYPNIIGYKVKYASSFNNTALAYNWNFGDGNTSSLANPTHTFSNIGTYNTCLQIDDGGSAESICNPIKTGNLNVCRTTILVNTIADKTVSFTNISSGKAPFTYRWDFGDGNYSGASNPQHTYDSDGIYFVKLNVSDSNGDSATHHYNVNTSLSMKPAPNFSVESINPVYLYNHMFSKIKFSYTDENGIAYSGHLQQQPNDSKFKIEEVSDYQVNENGKKTKKIKISFNCTLYNGSNSILIKNGLAVLAIAYPD
jgi:PKD repeat protein